MQNSELKSKVKNLSYGRKNSRHRARFSNTWRLQKFVAYYTSRLQILFDRNAFLIGDKDRPTDAYAKIIIKIKKKLELELRTKIFASLR